MADKQLNAQSLVTTSATTAPAAGTSETWSVTALGSGIAALALDETYALVDATSGASTAQQAEIVRVTACTGSGATSITVTRGVDGTTPVAHANPSTFYLVPVASWFKALSQYQMASPDQGRALRAFRGSYLGGVTTSPTDVLVIGASFEEGYGATLMTNNWVNVFRDVLRGFAQPKGMAGGGSTPASNSAYQAGVGNYFGYAPYGSYPSQAVYADSPIIAASGTFTNLATIGLGLRGLLAANAASFTIEFFGTGADLMYTTATTLGSFTWAVDGGGTTTVNTNVAASNGNRVQIRNLSRGHHTITCVTTAAGTGGTGVQHEGAVFYDGDEAGGIRVWPAGHSGYGAKDYVSGTGVTTWVNSIQSWNSPDLVIINLGFNDWQNGRTVAQIKADLLSIIAAVKAQLTAVSAPAASFVVMSSFKVTIGSPVDTWDNVVGAFYDIAAADDDVCVFDYQHWFGKTSDTAITTRGGILVADGVHPTDGGAAIIGGAMAEFVLDSSERMRDLVRWGLLPLSVRTASATSQGAGFASDTYLAGSGVTIPTGRLKPGTMYRCKFHVTKTAAGVATPIINVRLGTAGTTSDTARATLTFDAQTAAIDSAVIEVLVTFRTVGNGTIAVIAAAGEIQHSLAATGFSTSNASIKSAVSSGFDSTPAGTVIGLSVNGGTSAAWTVDLVQAELVNLA